MRIDKHLGPLALALIISAAALAAAPTPTGPPTIDFLSLDKNKDGKLSRAEVMNVDDLRADFDLLDTNHDDSLTPPEFGRWSRAGKTKDAMPVDPSTGPSGSSGAQHMPKSN